MQTVKSHVLNDGTTTIICPVCNRAKRISVVSLKYEKNALKVRCRCMEVFKVQLNYRSHYRKLVSLSGTYETFHQHIHCRGPISITNCSHGGVQFIIGGVNRLQPGYVLILNFQLDNKQLTSIKKLAMVRSVNDNVIGCEFFKQKDVYNALGFYLFR